MEQAEDVRICTAEAADRTAWVVVQVEGDQACGGRTEADAAHKGANAVRARLNTAIGAGDAAGNHAGVMGDRD